MAQLIFSDGKQLNLPHYKAAKIKLVLDGEEEPEDEAQAEFISKVADIRFEKLKKPQVYRNPKGLTEEQKIERRIQIQAVMSDPKLMGIEKTKAISKILAQPHRDI